MLCTSGEWFFQTDFRKWLVGQLFLDRHFQNHPNSVILQKHQPLLNWSFKHNSAHMSYFISTPKLPFEPRFCVLIINVYRTKMKHLYSLYSLSCLIEKITLCNFKRFIRLILHNFSGIWNIGEFWTKSILQTIST